MKLDAIDLKILEELQNDGGLSNVELAKRVHLSPSPCLNRVRSLQTAGVINRYVAIANPAALGLDLNVFISIGLKSQDKESLAAFEQRISEHDEVMECYLMTGDSDYLIRVAVANIAALEHFILEQLTPIPGIRKNPVSFRAQAGQVQDGTPLAACSVMCPHLQPHPNPSCNPTATPAAAQRQYSTVLTYVGRYI